MTETPPVRDEPVEPGEPPGATEEFDVPVEANPEPAQEPSDPHTGPLDDDDDDARFLDPSDPRRLEVERRRGRPFRDDDEED
jgi:hypothetical protein